MFKYFQCLILYNMDMDHNFIVYVYDRVMYWVVFKLFEVSVFVVVQELFIYPVCEGD